MYLQAPSCTYIILSTMLAGANVLTSKATHMHTQCKTLGWNLQDSCETYKRPPHVLVILPVICSVYIYNMPYIYHVHIKYHN